MFAAEVDPRSRMHGVCSWSQERAASPSPLERRVSFCEACAGVVVSDPPEEPRNNFMKFCATDAILTSGFPSKCQCLGLTDPKTPRPTPHHSSKNSFRRRGLRLWLSLELLNLDLAFEVRAFFNGNTLGGDISSDNRSFAQFHPVAGVDIAFELPLHNDTFCFDVGFNLAVWPHCQIVTLECNAAFDLAIHIQILTARELAFDHHRFPKLCQLARHRHSLNPFLAKRDSYQTNVFEISFRRQTRGSHRSLDYTERRMRAASCSVC